MKAVILAGGLGRRMLPYTKSIPKPMLLLGKKPILEHSISWLSKSGVRDIVICTSHMHKKIVDYFGDGSKFGVNIEYARTKKPMSTAGQLRAASDMLDSRFVCLYGDSIFGHSICAMKRNHAKTRADITICVTKKFSRLPYGVIRTGRGGSVTEWVEKPETESLINVGCYVMEPEVLSLIPANKAMGMDKAIARAISARMRVKYYDVRGKFLDVGNIGVYKAAQAKFGARRRLK